LARAGPGWGGGGNLTEVPSLGNVVRFWSLDGDNVPSWSPQGTFGRLFRCERPQRAPAGAERSSPTRSERGAAGLDVPAIERPIGRGCATGARGETALSYMGRRVAVVGGAIRPPRRRCTSPTTPAQVTSLDRSDSLERDLALPLHGCRKLPPPAVMGRELRRTRRTRSACPMSARVRSTVVVVLRRIVTT
jgi:hypothetical protein